MYLATRRNNRDQSARAVSWSPTRAVARAQGWLLVLAPCCPGRGGRCLALLPGSGLLGDGSLMLPWRAGRPGVWSCQQRQITGSQARARMGTAWAWHGRGLGRAGRRERPGVSAPGLGGRRPRVATSDPGGRLPTHKPTVSGGSGTSSSRRCPSVPRHRRAPRRRTGRLVTGRARAATERLPWRPGITRPQPGGPRRLHHRASGRSIATCPRPSCPGGPASPRPVGAPPSGPGPGRGGQHAHRVQRDAQSSPATRDGGPAPW
jgi:hypothetical protein